MNLLEYNKKSVTGLEYYDFNCGGFALGTFDWYEPATYYESNDKIDDGISFDKILEGLAEDIHNDFPWLVRIDDPNRIPEKVKVIGFRLEIDENYPCEYCEQDEETCDICTPAPYEIEDFHFVVRWEGEWYHKPGPAEITILNGDPWEPWVYHSFYYNSNIVWFADYTAEPWHGYS